MLNDKNFYQVNEKNVTEPLNCFFKLQRYSYFFPLKMRKLNIYEQNDIIIMRHVKNNNIEFVCNDCRYIKA